MNYQATIRADTDSELILKTFEPEEKQAPRSHYTIKKEAGGVLIEIYSKDATALRATITSITKILNIIEKAKELK